MFNSVGERRFASLDVVCIQLYDCVCMFIVSKSLLISSAVVIVRTGGAIWLNPLATVSFNLCNAVTVECCVLYPCCLGVFCIFAILQCL